MNKPPANTPRSKRQRQTTQRAQSDQLEKLWSDLLSRQPQIIQAAFDSLDSPDRKIVLAHLKRMAVESGWQPEQSLSAQSALEVLQPQSDQE